MIIRCPDCSTGFKLPESRVTSNGIKLRCSRCSHVFRVRSTGDGESEIYYHAEDREDGLGEEAPDRVKHGDEMSDPLEELEEDLDDGADANELYHEAGNRTIFGMPTAASSEISAVASEGVSETSDATTVPAADEVEVTDKVDKKAEEPAKMPSFAAAFAEKKAKLVENGGIGGGITGGLPKPGFNPFPHTGLDLKPRKRNAFGNIGEDIAADIEEATVAAMTPSADIASDLQVPVAQATQVDQPVVSKPVEHAEGVVSDGLFAKFDAPAVTEVARPVAAPAVVAAPFAVQENEFLGAPEDFVDDSFQHDGPYFEPERERVEVGGAVVAGAGAGVVVAAAKPTKPAVPVSRGQSAVSGAASQPARVLEPVAESWEVDEISTNDLGGSTGVKLLLSTVFVLLIGAGFVGFVAAQNDGIVDFKQFGSMVKVAFGQGEYTPRAGREEAAPVVVAAVENPIEVHSVFAELANYGGVAAAKGKGARVGAGKPEAAGQVLVLRGQVRNRDSQTFSGVKLRGLVLNEEGRVLHETTGLLGGQVRAADLEAVQSPQEAAALLPKSASPLKENMAAPFTLIFEQIPQAVLEQNAVMYRVEIASKDEGIVTAQTP